MRSISARRSILRRKSFPMPDSGKHFFMWIVHEKPPDFPNAWVARCWIVYDVPQPTPELLISPSLEVLEDILRDHGFSKLARSPGDAPGVLSTWI